MDKYLNKSENFWTTRSVKKFSEDNMLTQKNKMHQKGLTIPSVNQKAWKVTSATDWEQYHPS